MSIATAIQAAQQKVADAYTAASAKGATMPATQNLSNLATTISTISGGSVDTTGWIPRAIDANGKLVNSDTMIDLTGVTDVDTYCLYGAYYGAIFPANTTIDMSSITTLSGGYACANMFRVSRNVISVDLSSLETVSGQDACDSMFDSCYTLTSADLSSLKTISGSNSCYRMFAITELTSINLSSLTTVSGNNACQGMFQRCSVLVSVKLNALNVITVQIGTSWGQTFGSCYKLESVEFGGLTASTFSSITNQLQYIFDANTGSQAPNGCTVHFPSNFDPSDPNHTFDASTLAGYPTFGGSASYIHVAFDLPATE